jgi:hypothetical protein
MCPCTARGSETGGRRRGAGQSEPGGLRLLNLAMSHRRRDGQWPAAEKALGPDKVLPEGMTLATRPALVTPPCLNTSSQGGAGQRGSHRRRARETGRPRDAPGSIRTKNSARGHGTARKAQSVASPEQSSFTLTVRPCGQTSRHRPCAAGGPHAVFQKGYTGGNGAMLLPRQRRRGGQKQPDGGAREGHGDLDGAHEKEEAKPSV